MKKLIVAVLVFLLSLAAVQAQGPEADQPRASVGGDPCEVGDVSYWHVIVPESTTNEVLNPSAETTGNFTAEAGTSVTRVTTYNRYGLYSYYVQTDADNEGVQITTDVLANAIHYATVRVRGTLPAAWDWSMDNLNWRTPTLIEQLDANWALYGVQFPAAECTGQSTLRMHQSGAGAGAFYLDGIQMEQKSYWTTYVDGDQEGCAWDGAEHASTSSRSAATPAGGRQRDLQEDYAFDVGGMTGVGVPSQNVIVDRYAVLPGGEVNIVKVQPRSFTLTGVVRGTSLSDLHDNLDDLSSVLMGVSGCRDVRLRYTGATAHKEIRAMYEGGMEGDIQATGVCYWQRMAVRFLAEDPYWYDYGGTGGGGSGCAVALDTNDSATLRYIAARLRSTGQWDDLGLTANPTAFGRVYAIAIAPDGSVYVGGNFTGMNNVVGRDYIARYIPSTDTWAYVGMPSDLNDVVYGLAFDAAGTLYVVGAFTDAGGVPAADYITTWNGSTWAAVGLPLQGAAAITFAGCITIDRQGDIYIGGDFTNWADIGDADYFVKWDGSAYSAVGSGGTGQVRSVVVDNNYNIYIGGNFLNWAAVDNADYLAWWNGSAWAAVNDTAANNQVYALLLSPEGRLYIGGAFTDLGSVSNADGIALYNGTAFEALGTGVNGTVWALAYRNNVLYAGGNFTEAGGASLADRVAKWNGASWTHLDVDFPGTPNVDAFALGDPDPVITANYDIYVGFDTTGAGYFAGTATVVNNGTSVAYPTIVFNRSGGTSATIYQVRNESTGKELLFDYDLLDGETLTIDLRPTRQSIVSSMFGSRPDAILANSDMGSFTLQPGDNRVTAFVNVSGVPTITAWIEWRTQYRGF